MEKTLKGGTLRMRTVDGGGQRTQGEKRKPMKAPNVRMVAATAARSGDAGTQEAIDAGSV